MTSPTQPTRIPGEPLDDGQPRPAGCAVMPGPAACSSAPHSIWPSVMCISWIRAVTADGHDQDRIAEGGSPAAIAAQQPGGDAAASAGGDAGPG